MSKCELRGALHYADKVPLDPLRRLSSLRPPHGSVLDVLKFVCKDVWTAIWEKQVDNLRTNHRVSNRASALPRSTMANQGQTWTDIFCSFLPPLPLSGCIRLTRQPLQTITTDEHSARSTRNRQASQTRESHVEGASFTPLLPSISQSIRSRTNPHAIYRCPFFISTSPSAAASSVAH